MDWKIREIMHIFSNFDVVFKLYLKENWSANDHSSLAESDSDNLIWSNSKSLIKSLTSTDFFQ